MNAANASLQAASLENERRAHEPSMEEILASIRRIIADDDALPLTRPVAEPRATTAPPLEKPLETNVMPLTARPAAVVAEPAPAAPFADASAGHEAAPEALATVEPFSAHSADGASAPVEAWRPHESEPLRLEPPAFGSTVLRHTPDDDDMASLAEIASELAAHDLLPAIAEESPHEILSGIHAANEEVDADDVHAAAETHADATDGPAILSAETDASVSSAFRALSASVELASSEAIDRQVRELLRPMLKQWLDDNLPVMVERLVRAEIERVARGGR